MIPENNVLKLDDEDLARLGPRRRRRIGRLPRGWSWSWHVWGGTAEANEARRQAGKERRGRLLVKWAKLAKRQSYGRLAKLAAELGVSRWTIYRDVKKLRKVKLITTRRQSVGRPTVDAGATPVAFG